MKRPVGYSLVVNIRGTAYPIEFGHRNSLNSVNSRPHLIQSPIAATVGARNHVHVTMVLIFLLIEFTATGNVVAH